MHISKLKIIIIVVLLAIIGAITLFGGFKNMGKGGIGQNAEEVRGSADSTKVYLHSDESFSFSFPGDFTFSALEGADSAGAKVETSIFSGITGDRNFQIHITTYREQEQLTAEVIQQSLPDLLMEEPQVIAVAGAKGVAFLSGPKDSTFRTREIWFSHNGKLYQVSTIREFDDQMVNILSTWKWAN